MIAFDWMDFLPEDNVRDHRLQYLNQDLVMLLRLKHHMFWSQIVHDKALISFLNTFLMYAKRVGTTRATTMSGMGGASELSADLSSLSLSHKTLMRNVFTVILRLATGKESASCGFGSAHVHGDLVYGVLDLPRLLDFVSLYSRFNLPVVANIVHNLFSIQPKYAEELGKTVVAGNQVLMESWRQLSSSLQAALSPSTAEPANSDSTDPAEPTSEQVDRFADMRETGEDLANYLVDLLYTLSTFAKVHPQLAKPFIEADFISSLSYTLRAALPNLRLIFEGGGSPAAVDTLRRHVATRNHALSLINKILSFTISEIQDSLEAELGEMSPEALIKQRVANITPKLDSLINQLQALIAPDRQLVERVAKRAENARPFAWLLIEDDQQQSAHASANITSSGSLNTSTGLAISSVSAEANTIARDLDEKYDISALLAELLEQLSTSIGASPLISERMGMISGLRMELRGMAEMRRLATSQSLQDKTPSASSSAVSRQKELKWQESVKKAEEMKSILTDVSVGFLAYALSKYYDNNSERLMNDYWDQKWSAELKSVDSKLSLEKSRAKLFEGTALRSAEEEEAQRFGKSVDVDSLRRSQAKREQRKKMKASLEEYRASFSSGRSEADAEAMAALTLRFMAAQDKVEEERTYMTQIKRARGSAVDEDDEELYEQLKTSRELRERAERGALTYEDEPDDSLDDFHPVSAMADADRDSSLLARRGPLRSKFSNHQQLNIPQNRNADNSSDDEEQEEGFAGDYGQTIPGDASTVPLGSSHRQSASSGRGGSQHHKGSRGGGGAAGNSRNAPSSSQPRASSNQAPQSNQSGPSNAHGHKSGQRGGHGGAGGANRGAQQDRPAHAAAGSSSAPQQGSSNPKGGAQSHGGGRGAPRQGNAQSAQSSGGNGGGRGKPSQRGGK